MKIAAYVLAFLIAIAGVSALTATMDQSKSVVRPGVGETLIRTISVHNTNSFSVKVKVTTVDDSGVVLEVIDQLISLEPNEENNILFTLTATQSGTHDVKVCTQWQSPGQTAIGLCAAITVITKESGLAQLESKVSAIESWKLTFESQIDGLFDWLHKSQNNDLCSAVSNECDDGSMNEGQCSKDSDCGASGFIGEPYCSGSHVFQKYKDYSCNIVGFGLNYCTSDLDDKWKANCDDLCYRGRCVQCVDSYDCSSGYECRNDACVLPSTCSFRTSAVGGQYKSGTWVAVDADSDSLLEGFAYTSSSGILAECQGSVIAATPEGYPVVLRDSKVIVCVGSAGKWVEKRYYTLSSDADTNGSPTNVFSEVC